MSQEIIHEVCSYQPESGSLSLEESLLRSISAIFAKLGSIVPGNNFFPHQKITTVYAFVASKEDVDTVRNTLHLQMPQTKIRIRTVEFPDSRVKYELRACTIPRQGSI